MLFGYCQTGCGYVEHVQYHGLVASVLAAMDCAYHFDERLALVERTFIAVFTYDGQFALFHYAVVNHVVMVSACFGAYGKNQPFYYQFGFARRIIRQGHAVPTC